MNYMTEIEEDMWELFFGSVSRCCTYCSGKKNCVFLKFVLVISGQKFSKKLLSQERKGIYESLHGFIREDDQKNTLRPCKRGPKNG